MSQLIVSANGPMKVEPQGQPLTDRQVLRTLEVMNATFLSRAETIQRFFDPRRDINDECGYPTTGPLIDQYQELYDREAVAARVVEVWPSETWQVQPSVYELEDPETNTDFEVAWRQLGQSISSEPSYYQDEEGSAVWEWLQRADELSGIGHYGVILLGLDDGRDLSEPASPRKGQKLTFVRCFPESLSQIVQFESDPRSPRYGLPVRYSITYNDPREATSGIGLTFATLDVHWTRVVHVVDNPRSSVVFGAPRMRPVLNRILDLRKLYGGSAEMYWRGAFPGYSVTSHPQLGGDVQLNSESIKTAFENYMNGLQRYLAVTGGVVQSLAPQVVDPSPQIRVQLEAICIELDIPMRIFMGSERGELSSEQDSKAWTKRVRGRQTGKVNPRLIAPFVNRLVYLGVLPEPAGYSIYWPDITSSTDQEQADIVAKRTAALAQYSTSRASEFVSEHDYLTYFQGLNDAEAASIIAAAVAAYDKKVKEGRPVLGQDPPGGTAAGPLKDVTGRDGAGAPTRRLGEPSDKKLLARGGR